MPHRMNHQGRTFMWFALLVAATIVGLWALWARFSKGLIVTHLTQHVPWGFWVALYIYFIGLSAGSFLLSTLAYVFGVKRFEAAGRIAVFQALVCLLLGIMLILIDLGHPERFYKVLTSTNPTSVLGWECYFYTVYVLILLAELHLLMRQDCIRRLSQAGRFRRLFYRSLCLGRLNTSLESQQADRRWVKWLGIVGIPVAIGVHGGTGAIFAVVKARPIWYTGLFPIIFLISALVSGAALLTFFMATLSHKKDIGIIRSLAKLTGAILCFDILLLVSEILVVLYGGIPTHVRAYHLIFTGQYWWVFWLVQLLLGTFLPLLLIFAPATASSIRYLRLASLLIVIGIIGVRLNIVIPPLIDPAFKALPMAYHNFRFSVGYFPSLNEWLSAVGIIAAGAWAFLVAKRFLPLEEESETRPGGGN